VRSEKMVSHWPHYSLSSLFCCLLVTTLENGKTWRLRYNQFFISHEALSNFSLNSHVFHTVDSFEFICRNVKQKKGLFTATEQHIINIIKENPTLWQEAIAQIIAEIPDMWSDKSPDVVQNELFPTGFFVISKNDHSLVSLF